MRTSEGGWHGGGWWGPLHRNLRRAQLTSNVSSGAVAITTGQLRNTGMATAERVAGGAIVVAVTVGGPLTVLKTTRGHV